jgi:probable HAF family extracellular repeat protein
LGGNEAMASGINNAGQIVGSASNGNNYWHAFRYTSGAMQDLGTLGGSVSGAEDINRHGHVVGSASVNDDFRWSHAFLYDGGGMRDLGTFGGNYSAAWGLNDAGYAVGYAATANNAADHAFLYANGVLQDLGTLGGTYSFANDINNSNQVVGNSNILGDAGTHAFLYSSGGMTDLNALIDPASGWTIHFAYGINDLGQIAATGCRAGQCVALRLDVAALAAPEPSTWATLLCGLAVLIISLRLRRREPPAFRAPT